MALIAESKIITAIKRLREKTGSTLKGCKEWVDARLQTVLPSVRNVGMPCPYCSKPLRTDQAKQCFECARDWHDPRTIVTRI